MFVCSLASKKFPFHIAAFKDSILASAIFAAFLASAASPSKEFILTIVPSAPAKLFNILTSFCNIFIKVLSSITSLILANVFTSLARCANSKVERVSSRYKLDGVAQQMIAILAFPDNEGCKRRVNLESRKLMCLLDEEPNAEITLDNDKRLLQGSKTVELVKMNLCQVVISGQVANMINLTSYL